MLCPKCGSSDQSITALQCTTCNVVFSKFSLKCPRCNHNAVGLEIKSPGVCPECGAEIAKFLQHSKNSTANTKQSDNNKEPDQAKELKKQNKPLSKWVLYSLASIACILLLAKYSDLSSVIVPFLPIALVILIWQLHKRSLQQADTAIYDDLKSVVGARPRTITRKYKGSHSVALEQFSKDLTVLEKSGYSVAQQTWIPGSYTTGQFIGAVLLCILIIGILIFLYMLFVKPAGTLTVTYQLEEFSAAAVGEQKPCPKCAENVKLAASVCRYCGHNFAT